MPSGSARCAGLPSIYTALARRDAPLSQAAALPHVSGTEEWLREHVGGPADGP